MSDRNSKSDNRLMEERREKLQGLRVNGFNYPSTIAIDSFSKEIIGEHDSSSKEDLEGLNKEFKIAGRMMAKRVMGKSSFSRIKDGTGSIQVFLSKADLGEESYGNFKTMDVGDIVWVKGTLFRTKTDELTLNVTELILLSKSLRPLPEKYHGLTDTETRYRRRYLDLMMSEESAEVFKVRSKVVTQIRSFLNDLDMMEVETPMMHPIPGGAVARPFVTHHNTLDQDFYLRIAPELYLKRLTVGGFDRVYEINRSFRNEGVSTQHNPEFTMLELYVAHETPDFLMGMIEDMMRSISQALFGSESIEYQDTTIDLSKSFNRLTMEEAVLKYNPSIDKEKIRDAEYLISYSKEMNLNIEDHTDAGKILFEIFEKTVEHELQQPTYITSYPRTVSPLSRANDADPWIVDRFEFFIAGRELANGFQELNDPEDQAQRFEDQVKARDGGDDEAMFFDQDYIEALEYGMPPTAGLGVGIDRLVMVFADQASIRDVLFFPHMRKK
ncbi:MAG: lysine--tRNA ligase [Gammaproteobacteria bacterium]|jgi:lysyl-tRNA synthetase class 2|nr:lysine--tRNA ligase [Gammaproteobacteria bacterium]MDP6146791.1 lysine--tRNA ligase [Gammaproteobacteria bacterium]HJL80016.1 lysine--tRNA ligase [Gammaproteobacteria bacterium]HJM09498.1 lysine--tRNA ligase [Gammaproteobacteria bacterium]HJN01344.1 lysine--tRNA ligase [Gammaproteobacteria bacterium]|tara:strand:- start:18491 stop:19984 length:1494 start_codon:yes stop_codon:yes gene_type:complete